MPLTEEQFTKEIVRMVWSRGRRVDLEVMLSFVFVRGKSKDGGQDLWARSQLKEDERNKEGGLDDLVQGTEQ